MFAGKALDQDAVIARYGEGFSVLSGAELQWNSGTDWSNWNHGTLVCLIQLIHMIAEFWIPRIDDKVIKAWHDSWCPDRQWQQVAKLQENACKALHVSPMFHKRMRHGQHIAWVLYHYYI